MIWEISGAMGGGNGTSQSQGGAGRASTGGRGVVVLVETRRDHEWISNGR